MLKYYPINLDLKNKRCVVIGAGGVAERKVRRLVECGANVSVVGPDITSGLKAMADKGKIRYKRGRGLIKDVKGAYLVIAATSDRSVNSVISSYCREKGILVNVVDKPDECAFILPSIIRRGDLTISISTGGISPALSRKIRLDLEKVIGMEYGAVAGAMKKIRPMAKKKMKSMKERKKFMEDILNYAGI
ncbi:MAG: bifunctional precorrin-2 dehydrogenase/sirohydrochlorin ferrochelatase [Candidatus Omnitrophica bacterium]|nr:bifunctional precorrin-2 dehydrogenase/sirohydrochlorin ferrochelatase [Candidatus Omnitrophota bacterium]